jgi:hypothetical protein
MSGGEELRDEDGTEIAGTAGDEDFHGKFWKGETANFAGRNQSFRRVAGFEENWRSCNQTNRSRTTAAGWASLP